MKNLHEIAKKIANILKIELPEIEIDLSGKYSCSEYMPCADKILIIRQEDTGEAFFELFHEMRHKWQWINKFDEYFSGYQEMDDIGLEMYGRQKAEVDANGFAVIMSAIFLGCIPEFKGYPMQERRMIFDRARELSKQYEVNIPWEDLYVKFGLKK